ncbi:neutral cholesterol ester hydrolase 1-like [Amphiura filiformis]|uniref:neutral cholesterol ester hydrolase 1-like n=1 Tax=Amphiura filiformis TaxID=82378 RepID=UPI003B20DA59
MNRKLILGVLVGLVAVYVGYFASLPVPEGLPEPWKMRAFVMVRYTMGLIGRIFTAGFSRRIVKGVQQGHNSTRIITNVDFDGVPVRIYAPPDKQSEPLPALVCIHGGGWVMGSVDTYHFFTNDVATKLDGIVLISVEYRLAPLYPFPAAIDDCTIATAWLLSHTEEFNVDPNRIGVLGDNAGGNLAAAVSQRLTFDSQYSHLPKLRLQALIYPALQAVDFEMPSYQQNGRYVTLVLSEELMVVFWGLYLRGIRDSSFENAAFVNNHTSPSAKYLLADQGILSHSDIPEQLRSGDYVPPTSNDFGNTTLYDSIKDTLLNPDFAPLMRTDLGGLPEAYIATCYFDVLRDDGIIYAKRLEDAGVKVTWKNYEVGTHGSMTMNHDGLFKLESGIHIRHDLVTFLNNTLIN